MKINFNYKIIAINECYFSQLNSELNFNEKSFKFLSYLKALMTPFRNFHFN